MRSPLLGVVFTDNPELLKDFVKRSTLITHSDPKAYQGALGTSLAALMSSKSAQISPDVYRTSLQELMGGAGSNQFLSLMERACQSAARGESTTVFAETIGCRKGISAYVFHTVPCVIQTWLRYSRDFSGGIREIIAAGGDTDTTAAILGGIIGTRVGKQGIPAEWLNRIVEWPRSISWMERLGKILYQSLYEDKNLEPPFYFAPGILIRNLVFLLVVLGHGFRRLGPPY
jgi:ADP-ribosylglycohydrolase